MFDNFKALSKRSELFGYERNTEDLNRIASDAVDDFRRRYGDLELGLRMREVKALEEIADSSKEIANAMQWVKKRVEQWEKKQRRFDER